MTTKRSSKEHKEQLPFLEKLTAIIMTVFGSIGLLASLMLSIEEIKYLKNPGQSLSCDINPLIGCGSIMDTWQGHVFLGIPNQFFGLMAFSVILTFGVLILSKVKLPDWIWKALQIGMLGGVIFVFWFIYQSAFVLNHLCPYCMVTWGSVLPIAWYTTVRNISTKTILAKQSKLRGFVAKHHVDVIVGLVVILVLAILFRFREFFFG